MRLGPLTIGWQKAGAKASVQPSAAAVTAELPARPFETLSSFAALAETMMGERKAATIPAFTARRDEISSSSTGGRQNRLSFADLRYIADNADLIRIAIEDIKNTIRGLDWSLLVDSGDEPSPAAMRLLECPDGVRSWDQWATLIIEEVLVTDTLTLFPVYQRGKAVRLEVIDGTTITPLLDPSGRTPLPPLPAYEQAAPGQTMRFSADELWYWPFNQRVSSPYGYPAVEQVAIRASVNLHKALKDLEKWLTGGMPGAIVGCPNPDWSPAQVQEYQRWLDTRMNEQGAHTKIHAVAGDPKIQVISPPRVDKDHEELLIRIICKVFGVDPTALVSQVNYSTADALQRQSLLVGKRPALFVLEAITNRFLTEAGFPDHKLYWLVDQEAQNEVTRTRMSEEYKIGLRSWEEVRQQLGEAVDEESVAGMHFFMSGGAMNVFNPYDPESMRPPAPRQGVPFDGHGPEPDETDVDEEAVVNAADYRDDLKRCERWAKKALKAGKTPRDFRSDVIPAWRLTLIRKALRAGQLDLLKAFGTPADRDAFTNHTNSKRVKERVNAGADLFKQLLAEQAKEIKADAIRAFHRNATKAAGFDVTETNPIGRNLYAGIVDWLEILAAAGISDSSEWVGLGQIGDRAYQYAVSRAAELVGMKYDPDTGHWIPNPNQKWALTRTTRARVDSLLDTALNEGWTLDLLSERLDRSLHNLPRAEMIARTEAAFAYNRGTAMNWQAMGVTQVRIYDNEGPSSCAACAAANGQVWSLERFEGELLEHPNCVRTAFPTDSFGAGPVN